MAKLFNEKIQEKKYVVSSREEGRIILVKEKYLCDFTVIFNNNDKYLYGTIVPKVFLKSDMDLKRLTLDFNELKEDLYEFQRLSKYKLLNFNEKEN
jgi:hypothetical protein